MDRRTPDQSPGLRFLKMHGLGNDFVIIDARGGDNPVTPALARALGDRHRGVGFDQLAAVETAGDAAARLVFFNADGSESGACGNATRCIAHLLMEETGADSLTLLTANGRLAAERLKDGRVQVDMGRARTDWHEIPLARELDTVSLPLPGGPGAVSMGNPHCVLFVDDAESVPLNEFGPEWEHHPLFPERTNVEFAQVLSRDTIRLRVWERGVGVTLACGSGACAAVVAGVRKEKLDTHVTVHLDGGPLEVAYRADGHVLMTGPVTRVFEGRLAPEFLAQVAP